MQYRPPVPYLWHRFWGLSWWWKGPILGALGIFLLSGIAAAAGGGGGEKDDEATRAEETRTASATRTRSPATTRPVTRAPIPTTTAPTPSPAATPAPTAPPTPAGPATSFGSGTKRVGQDIAPGTYRGNVDGNFCYFERLSGFGGTIDDIITNDNTSAPEIVTIAPTDVGFNSERCGEWKQGLSPITASPTAPFGDGTFAVGIDIAPGTWSAPGGSGCYFERQSGFGHTTDEIITNDFGSVTPIVTISASDVGFSSDGCGGWTLQG
jgi:hypothetical protein